MNLEDINSKVVVVTQFDHFGEGPNSVNLTVLLNQLKQTYPTLFYGGIYYSNVDSTWQGKLTAMLKSIKQQHESSDSR